MKKFITAVLVFIPLFLSAQDYKKTTYSLQSEQINEKGKLLDLQIVEVHKKLADLIK
jgi:hypothetical protein